MFFYEKVYCKFLKLDEFLFDEIQYGQNIVHFIARWGTNAIVNFALEDLKTKLNREKFKELLKKKDANNWLPLHIVFYDERTEIFNNFFSHYENVFSESSLKEFLEMKVFYANERSGDNNNKMIDMFEYARMNKFNKNKDMKRTVESVLSKYEQKLCLIM
jgi:ankyrin repeat protein